MWVNSEFDWYPSDPIQQPTMTVLVDENEDYHEISPILDQNGNVIKKPKRKQMGFIHIGS